MLVVVGKTVIEDGQKKSELDYNNVDGVLQLIVMKNSPEPFKSHPGNKYIHRIKEITADSGLSYKPLCQMSYIQLDKCFKNLKDVKDLTEIQMLLVAMYDINDPRVSEYAKTNEMLSGIIEEVKELALSKEVQTMLLAEKYAIADMNAVRSYERREGRAEGLAEGRAEGLAEGQNRLVDAIRRIHSGETVQQLIDSGVDETTANLAYSCR